MEKVVRKAYAKINLGLDVLRKRADGYHEVKMVMQTVDLYDVLSLEANDSGEISISVGEAPLPVNEDNLIYKAADLMRQTYSIKQGVKIDLIKNIPIAAGMAGGSTDAAAVLSGMNDLFALQIPQKELEELAVKIGADVPYCIAGGTALSEGIGEVLTVLPDAPNCILLIAKPDLNVSTKYVYENLHLDQVTDRPDVDQMVEAITAGNRNKMIETMGNVLESVTGSKYPVIGEIEDIMIKHGAVRAMMSGSGPTVFGIFDTMVQAAGAFDAVKVSGYGKDIFISGFVNPKEEA